MTHMDGDGGRRIERDLPDRPQRAEALLRDRHTWAEPPPGFADDLLAAVRRERDRAPAVETRRSAASPVDVAPASPGRGRGRLLAVAAAALVVAVAAGVVVEATSDQPGHRSSDPDVVVLAGAAGSASASGRAEIAATPSGFEITLDVEGLPPAPADTYYQAWLRNAADESVTIGTFHARDGGDDIVLWSGVDPARYPTITVTLQREGAGAESSGDVVLSGTVD